MKTKRVVVHWVEMKTLEVPDECPTDDVDEFEKWLYDNCNLDPYNMNQPGNLVIRSETRDLEIVSVDILAPVSSGKPVVDNDQTYVQVEVRENGKEVEYWLMVTITQMERLKLNHILDGTVLIDSERYFYYLPGHIYRKFIDSQVGAGNFEVEADWIESNTSKHIMEVHANHWFKRLSTYSKPE